jgi:hypothetical protein
MNDGMPGMNNHCYTEATGHPANRNCSSGWTKQQRAPVNSSQLRPTTASFEDEIQDEPRNSKCP